MAAVFPTIPRIIFTILEPISLVAGFVVPFIKPAYFVSNQLTHIPPHPLLPTEEVLAYQLANTYGLVGLIGIAVLQTTHEPATVHRYIWACWLADISHVGITAYAMGWNNVMDVGSWNDVAWGNIGATSVLFLMRCLYLLGVFGPDRIPTQAGKQKRK